MFTEISIDGRRYRYSEERRISGRPAKIEYFCGIREEWREVRNVDRSDEIWKISDGDLEQVVDRYRQMIGAVQSKHDGEKRHETALRYIREREAPRCAKAGAA